MLKCSLIILLAGCCVPVSLADTPPTGDSNQQILQSFVEDFGRDPFAREMTFGFKVDDDQFHMVVTGAEPEARQATLHTGFPEQPILYWEMSGATLRRFDEGLNGETATSRARAEDPVLLKTRATPGFPRYTVNPSLNEFIEQFRLHFWTRGIPEVIPMGKTWSVESHGGNVVGLVYRQGLRTIWYQIEPGQHVNEDPSEQVNDFDTLVVPVSGEVNARLGGKLQLLQTGRAYLIPAGMAHEFWNDSPVPYEAILIMYGEGA